jgi:ribose 5-phosphate isomerase B
MIKDLRIAIDCDDAAVEFKQAIYAHIKSKGLDIVDLNYAEGRNTSYPEIGMNLALKVQSREFQRGILICGTGLGMAMIANKVEGVYAGVCHDVYSAERLVKSNDAQIITMGARVIGIESAKKIIDAWLESEYEGGRSAPKVDLMHELEIKSFSGRF